MTPRSTRGRRVVLALAVALPVVLAGCGAGNGQNSLEPKGDAARKIDSLFWPVTAIAIAVGVLIVTATLVVALKFRFRAGVNENPKQIHGNSKLEITWTIIPALILIGLAVPTVSTIFKLAEEPGARALDVTVVGKQWWWEFQYQDEDLVTANELVIPAQRKVDLRLVACDPSLPVSRETDEEGCNVIHSFWVPELAGKKDVVPGRANHLTIEADKPGTYLGQCAEYCGLSHANMRFRVIALSPSDYRDWVDEQQSGPVEEIVDEDGAPLNAAAELLQKYACTNCHVFDDSSGVSYGPNLTHLGSRTTFASGAFKLNKANLVKWLLDAPSMIPMESKDCRKGLGLPGVTCVGMPSFTKDTPAGEPVMSRADAEELADFLLAQE